MYVVFTPNFGEDEPILTSIFFQRGWSHQLELSYQVMQAVTLLFPSWRSISLWKGHLTIPKRSQRIARYQMFPKNCPFPEFLYVK